ncbi:hypothetical protein [Streptomyces violaceusniger]|uniref:hypothetical protein n=1 Tax=Streptomyces violaceusniger TaxID=68280 RepID=UPI0002F0D693|nr:hypothetical protein [Streptomyces violaceusniger]
MPTAQKVVTSAAAAAGIPMRLAGHKAVLRQDPDDGDTMPDSDAPSPASGGDCGGGDGCGRR